MRKGWEEKEEKKEEEEEEKKKKKTTTEEEVPTSYCYLIGSFHMIREMTPDVYVSCIHRSSQRCRD
jgi:hypothetical protein